MSTEEINNKVWVSLGHVKESISGGEMSVKKSGSGNSAEYTLTAIGAQFPFTKFEKIQDGFKLTITGEWEASDLLGI